MNMDTYSVAHWLVGHTRKRGVGGGGGAVVLLTLQLLPPCLSAGRNFRCLATCLPLVRWFMCCCCPASSGYTAGDDHPLTAQLPAHPRRGTFGCTCCLPADAVDAWGCPPPANNTGGGRACLLMMQSERSYLGGVMFCCSCCFSSGRMVELPGMFGKYVMLHVPLVDDTAVWTKCMLSAFENRQGGA
jgi:hypothetical protein